MMAFIDDFKARFPEIDAALADKLVPIYEGVWPCYYGGSYLVKCDREAILLLVAHLLVTDPLYAGSNAPSKSVNSKSVGSVSVSYDAGTGGSDLLAWLNSTRYGQLFNMLTSGTSKPRFV